MKVEIELIGCDDSTCFVVDASFEEILLLKFIASKTIEVSKYGCQPTMTVEVLND